MNRRAFMKAVGATALVMPAAVRALGPDDRDLGKRGLLCGYSGRRPNVILILCDDLGWGDLGCYGQKDRESVGKPHIDTPALDKMAEEGVQFMHAYTTAPVCAPARASMVTGKHQGHCNLRSNKFDCPIDAHMTIGTVMKQAGYATWHLGKWGIGGGYQSGGQPRRAMACDAGFDYSYGYPAHLHGHSYYHYESDWNSAGGSPVVENVSAAAYAEGRYADLSEAVSGSGFERDPDGTYYRRRICNAEIQCCYDTDLFTAKLKQLILNQQRHNEGKAEAQPFFAYACYTTVHGTPSAALGSNPCGFSDQTHMHVPPMAYPALDAGDSEWGGGVTFRKDASGYLAFKGTASTANTYIYPEYQGYPTWGQQRYATAVHHLDCAIADLRHFLKVRGLDRETLIVFTSDNGPAGEGLSSSGITWVENGLDSNAHLKGMKRWSYEGGIREPTLAVWPGVTDGVAHKTDLPMQFPAWMATLADAAGLPQPAHCDGVSLLPTLTGSGQQLPMRIYTEYFDGGSGQNFGFEQIVRDGNYVLIRNNGAGGTAELYDVVNDPSQTNNLAGQAAYAERVRYMTALLTTCRIPPAQVTDACGAPGAYWQSPDSFNGQTYPAVAFAGGLPATEVRLYFEGAGAWPWVPNFRTLLPEEGFLASDADTFAAKLSERTAGRRAFGVSLRGWIDLPSEQTVAFSGSGSGGCQLWIHEAHVLEYEAGACGSQARTASLKLAKGRHPFRLYLTTMDGIAGLCTVTAGNTRLA